MHIMCPSMMNDILIISLQCSSFIFLIIVHRADAKAEKHSKATKLLSMPQHSAKSVKSEKAVADAKAGKEPSAKSSKWAGEKMSMPQHSDSKAGKDSSAKGESKTAGPKGTADAKAGKEASEKAASEKAAAKSDKASQGKYIHVCCC